MHAGVEGAAPQSFLPTIKEGDEESASMCEGGGAMILQSKLEIPEPIVRGMSPEQSTGTRRSERNSAAKFSAGERGRRREECVDVRRRRRDDFAGEGEDTGADNGGHVTGAVNRQQAMNALEMEK